MTAKDHARAQGFDDCVAMLEELEVNPMASIVPVVSDHHHHHFSHLSSSANGHRRNSVVSWRNGIAVPGAFDRICHMFIVTVFPGVYQRQHSQLCYMCTMTIA